MTKPFNCVAYLWNLENPCVQEPQLNASAILVWQCVPPTTPFGKHSTIAISFFYSHHPTLFSNWLCFIFAIHHQHLSQITWTSCILPHQICHSSWWHLWPAALHTCHQRHIPKNISQLTVTSWPSYGEWLAYLNMATWYLLYTTSIYCTYSIGCPSANQPSPGQYWTVLDSSPRTPALPARYLTG